MTGSCLTAAYSAIDAYIEAVTLYEARKCDSSNRAQHGADGLIPIFPGLERGSCSCGRANAFLSYGSPPRETHAKEKRFTVEALSHEKLQQ